MATSSVLGLFADPYQIMQQQSAATDQRAAQFAEMDPMQRAQYGIYGGANRLAGGIAGAMGAQDPQLQLQSLRKQILQQVNQNDPQSLAQAAQALNQAGDSQGAQVLFQAAQTRTKDLLEADVKQSQITRNLRERPASMSELGKLQAERADLVAEFGESDPRVKQYDDKIKKLSAGKTLGEDLASGLAPLVGAIAGAQAKKMGEAGGTEVGKQTANVQGKYTALGSIKDAVDMLDKGIYSGGYGPMQEAAAKYAGGILRKDRLANTQEFRAYIGDVVIPRLQEFGGNDSVEELNYLRSVMAGDTSMEGSAIKNILQKADRKIRAGIDRLEKQQTAVTTGKPLPVGDTSTAPKVTKRFNSQTGQLEVVK